MLKGILASILFFIVTDGEARLGIMKMVGKAACIMFCNLHKRKTGDSY